MLAAWVTLGIVGTRNKAYNDARFTSLHDPERTGSVGTEPCTHPKKNKADRAVPGDPTWQDETDGIVSLGVGGKTLGGGGGVVWRNRATVFPSPQISRCWLPVVIEWVVVHRVTVGGVHSVRCVPLFVQCNRRSCSRRVKPTHKATVFSTYNVQRTAYNVHSPATLLVVWWTQFTMFLCQTWDSLLAPRCHDL